MALVAVVAAVGFALLGPTTTASAAPPPPTPTSDSSDREPSRWHQWQWKIYESWAGGALDPHDPYYKWKLLRQIATQKFFERFGGGGTTFSIKDDGPRFVKAVEEFHRRSKDTPDALRRQVTEGGDKIHELNQKDDQAKTLDEREKIEEDREVARRQYKDVAKRHHKVKQTRPDAESVTAKIQGLATKIGDLRNKISTLEEETKKSRPDRREKLRQLKTARTHLAQAEADRRRLQGPPDDDGDTGGTRTTPRNPKQPPKGPVSTGPTTTTSTTSKGTKGAKGTKGPTPAGPAGHAEGHQGHERHQPHDHAEDDQQRNGYQPHGAVEGVGQPQDAEDRVPGQHGHRSDG
ncbi:hypothetical protein AB0E27_37675 [Streptomyces sparsogenes]|uniref:hypothetical protein n=1 Tax=Streptomyces sparsogenes TaxID=67365 RepID=UPI0033EEB79D